MHVGPMQLSQLRVCAPTGLLFSTCRTNQTALLQQLLQGCCEAEDDLLVAAIQNKCSFKFIQALWEEPGCEWHRQAEFVDAPEQLLQ